MLTDHRGDARAPARTSFASPPRRSARSCPPSWSRPIASPPPSCPACTAAGAPAWARPSGNSGSTRPATRRTRDRLAPVRGSRHLFVREQEWEAAESVWLWCDLSNSMAFRSGPACRLKWERAALLMLALAGLLVRGGERWPSSAPVSGRRPGATAWRRWSGASSPRRRGSDPAAPCRRSRATPGSCFCRTFSLPIDQLTERFGQFGGLGARACLMQIVDPAEEELPYEGRVVFAGMEHEGQALIDHVGGVRARYAELSPRPPRDPGRDRGRQGWRFTSHRTDGSAERGAPLADGHARPAHRGLDARSLGAARLHAALAARRGPGPPALWLLLRVTPPAPRRIAFPPLLLLAGLLSPHARPRARPGGFCCCAWSSRHS